MIFSLAVRNIFRNLNRYAPMMLILVMVFSFLVIGNSVFNTTLESLYEVYAGNITGDLTISTESDENFTVFGSDQLLVGQYIVPPTLINIENLENVLSAIPQVESFTGLVSSVAMVEMKNQKRKCTVFGVNFNEYASVVKGLHLVDGSFPLPGEPGIIIQEYGWENPVDLIGERILLASGGGRSFTLREVPLFGVISYPVNDTMLENIVLVDADTARALNGYLYTDNNTEFISDEVFEVFDSEIDNLFGDETEFPDESFDEEGEIDVLSLFSDESTTVNTPVEARDKNLINNQAWNFILLTLKNKKDDRIVANTLSAKGINKGGGYKVRNWGSSVGGTAQLTVFLQILFNIGLLFVSLGAVIIATNALMLSVLERTGEIGTLRAMGSSKIRISIMIFLETLFVIFGSAVVGILLGKILINQLNNAEVIIINPYLQILFGGKPVKGLLSPRLVIYHLGAAFLFCIVSLLYPLLRALHIQPIEAMSE